MNSLAFSSDGTLLIAGGDMLHIGMLAWNTHTGQSMGEFNMCGSLNEAECAYVRSRLFDDEKPGRINAIVFMEGEFPAGQGMPFFGYGQAATELFWFVENDAGQWQAGRNFDFAAVVYGPDQAYRVSGRSDGLAVHMKGSGEDTGQVALSTPVLSLALEGNSSLLAAGESDGKIVLYSLLMQDGQIVPQYLNTLDGSQDAVTAVAFSSDGTLLASSSLDGTLRLWSVEAQEEIAVLEGPEGTEFRSIAFSPDGTLIVSAGSDGMVRLWAVDAGE